MVPLAFVSYIISSNSKESFLLGDKQLASSSISPASKRDIFLYRQIGVNFLCRSRLADVEFPKALGISSATFADIISQKHGGIVEELPDKKLTPKQLYLSAEVQILEGSIKYCPEQVPSDAKEKFKEFIDNKGSNKSNKK